MVRVLDDLSKDATLAASEANLCAAWSDIGCPLPGELHDGPDMLRILSGLPSPFWNAVYRARLNQATVDQQIDSRSTLVDEFGYLHLDSRGAELLFQVITAREERASIAIATNHPLSEWGQTFKDPRLAAAVVDRLTFRAHIIETGAESYRLRSTRKPRTGGQDKQ